VDRFEQIARIQSFVRSHPRSVLFDETTATLLDVAAGKTLALDLSRFPTIREETNQETHGAYLVLTRDDGVELALADPGIAFALDTRNSGPIPAAPKAVCMRDYAQALARIHHYLYDHPDAPVSRDTLAHIQFAIAILDGARRVGLDIGDEERELERCLAEVEKRAGSPPSTGNV
jgi:hypothetical protein